MMDAMRARPVAADHPCRRQGDADEIRSAQGAAPDRRAADARASARQRRRGSTPARTVVVVGEQAASRSSRRSRAHGRRSSSCRSRSSAPRHAVLQAKAALAGFDGDILILYGDVPLVAAETMRAMLDRLHAADAPAAVVLGFRPADPAQYGRIIADADGRIDKMVEYKDATAEERADRPVQFGPDGGARGGSVAAAGAGRQRQCGGRILSARHRHARRRRRARARR